MKDIFFEKRMWRRRGELKRHYDVVIVGGGSHGLATAYYLAKEHGVKDVAVLEKSYIGSGAAGRNTTIIRCNYRTPEGARFYEQSVKLYEGLSAELDFNMLFSQQGHLTLAHSDRGIITATERAEVNQLLDIDSQVIYPDEIAKLCPEMDLSDRPTWPVVAALYHPPGGIIRHDAVVWGYARGADRHGVEIHPYTEVTDIEMRNGRAIGVDTNRGFVSCDQVVSATAGWSTLIADMADVPLPITTHILQAFVTEPVKPFLDVVIVSSQMHVYVSQTDRGEFLIGAEIEPYSTYKGDRNFHLPRVLGAPCARALPAARTDQDPARVDGPLRSLPRLQPDSREDRGRQLPHLHGLGHLRLQGGADRGRDDGGARRDREAAGADPAVRARALLH